jgi:hypothetical protein
VLIPGLVKKDAGSGHPLNPDYPINQEFVTTCPDPLPR